MEIFGLTIWEWFSILDLIFSFAILLWCISWHIPEED